MEAAPTETLTFPVIPWRDIQLVVEELAVPINAAQLQTPTPETVSLLYDAFVELLTGRHDVNAPTAIPYPELHQHSVGSLSYLKNLSKLMLAAGVKDFSVMEDLMNPDKKRLQRHLSALINITKYREQKMEVYSQWTKRTDELLETKEELEERQTLDHQRLQALREQQKQQEPQVLALTEECSQLQKQVNELNLKQARLKEHTSRLKHDNGEIQAAIESHKHQISNCESDIAQLRNSIVENPAAVEASIRENGAAIIQEQKGLAKIEAECEGLERKVRVLSELQRDAKEAVGLLRECADEEKRANKLESESKETRSAGDSATGQLQAAEAEREQLDKRLQSVAEKTARLTKQQKKREKEAARDAERAAAERARAETELAANENKAAENGRAAERLEQKMAAMAQQHQQDVARMHALYDQLAGQVHKYHHDLASAF